MSRGYVCWVGVTFRDIWTLLIVTTEGLLLESGG